MNGESTMRPAVLAMIAFVACVPDRPRPEGMATALFDVGVVVEAGGRVYADGAPSLSADAVDPPHEIAAIDPVRGFTADGTASDGVAIWKSGAIALGARLDDSNLIGYERDPTVDLRLHLIALAPPALPRVAATTTLADTKSFYLQTVTALADGNVFVWLGREPTRDDRSMPKGPLDRGYVVDPRAQAVRSMTPRLSCATVHLFRGYLACVDRRGVLHVFPYSTAGGLAPEILSLTLPTTGTEIDSYRVDDHTLHVIDGSLDTSALIVVQVDDDGHATVGATIPAPTWDGQRISMIRGLPMPGGPVLFITSSGLAIFDPIARTFTRTGIGGYGTWLTTVASLGPDYVALGVELTGVHLLRVANRTVSPAGSFNGW
jgi:hypothetical protein